MTAAAALHRPACLFVAAFAFPVYWMLRRLSRPRPGCSVFRRSCPTDGARSLSRAVRRAAVLAADAQLPHRLCSDDGAGVFLGTPGAYALTRLSSAARPLLLARAGRVDAAANFARPAALPRAASDHLINTYTGLVLPYLRFALPLAIWLLVGYFRSAAA